MQIDVVVADLTTVRTSATEFQPDVDAVESALQELRTAVSAAASPAEEATAAIDGLSNVSATWEALDEAGATCD